MYADRKENYGSVVSINLEFYPIGIDAWKLLKPYTCIVKDIWQIIWNLLIKPTNKTYLNILSLGSVSRRFYYNIFQPTYLKIADNYMNRSQQLFDNQNFYNTPFYYDKLNMSLTLANTHWKNKKTVDHIINKYKPLMQSILARMENSIKEKDEPNYMFLCEMYEYDYESTLMWQCKTYTCLYCYIPVFLTCCPLITLCLPCICVCEIMEHCSHDYGNVEPPLLLLPFHLHKKQYKNRSIDDIMSGYTYCRCCIY